MDKGIIPPEQIAKAGTDAKVGTILKHFHNDIHRTMHINSMVVSANLRLHVFDFSTESLLGLDTPAVCKPDGRKLRCSIERTRVNYWRVLMQLTNKHRMFKKANDQSDGVSTLTPSEFQLQFNAWDKELIQLMLAAEKKCRIFKNDHIPFSPRVGAWIKHRNLFQWILGYKSGKRVSKRNLFDACKMAGTGSPNFMMVEDAQLNEYSCIKKLEEIKKHAPVYRLKHLQDRLDEMWPEKRKMSRQKRQSFAFSSASMIRKRMECYEWRWGSNAACQRCRLQYRVKLVLIRYFWRKVRSMT
jgi:hypothetical protein